MGIISNFLGRLARKATQYGQQQAKKRRTRNQTTAGGQSPPNRTRHSTSPQDPPDEPRETQKPTLIQKMIIGERNPVLPEQLPVSQGGLLARMIGDMQTAIAARGLNRRLNQQDDNRLTNPLVELAEDKQYLKDYNRRNLQKAREEGRMGDIMSGKYDDRKNQSLDPAERDRRIREERKKRAEEELNESTEKIGRGFSKLGKSTGGVIGGMARIAGGAIGVVTGLKLLNDGMTMATDATNRRNLAFAAYSGRIASEEARQRGEQLRRDVRMANATADSSVDLGRARARYEDAAQPTRELVNNFSNQFWAGINTIRAVVTEQANEGLRYLGLIEKNTKKEAGDPLAQLEFDKTRRALESGNPALWRGFRVKGKKE